MFAEPRNLTWTLGLLFLAGAFQWEVKYQQQHICAVEGSFVVISCSFFYPRRLNVTRVMWAHERHNFYKGPFIFDSRNNTSSRFVYIGDKKDNCSFKIQQVEHEDAGKYAFRFETTLEEGRYTGVNGPTLKVVDLNISVTKPNGDTWKEGDSVNLTCVNGCDDGLVSSTFTWFHNGEAVNEGSVLYLSNMPSTVSGSYTCSLSTQTGTTSRVVNIDVEYAPKNTSVSGGPLMEVDGGSNITLICSSHANPPVENYAWFRIGGDGDDGVTAVGHQPVFVSSDGGQYFCRASNKHGGRNSSVVTVRIKHKQVEMVTFTRDVSIIITAVAVLLIVTSVFAITRLKKKRTRAPETDCEEETQNNVYVNWPVYDDEQCRGGTAELIYATVDFQTHRKLDIQRQQVHREDPSVTYSTVYRKQLQNPSYIET